MCRIGPMTGVEYLIDYFLRKGEDNDPIKHLDREMRAFKVSGWG
jgi:hypothetical protein